MNQQSPTSQLPKSKKFEVNFTGSDFSQQVTGIAKGQVYADAPLKNFANTLVYIAYNADGLEVSRLKQDSTGNTIRIRNVQGPPAEEDAGKQDFGCIKDSLPAGEYTMVMIASKQFLSISNRGEQTLNYSFEPLSNASFYYRRGLNSWSRAKDTFFKKFSITVENKDSQQKVVLDRIVGKAEINVLDAKPGTKLKFLFVHENEAFKFSDELPFGITVDLDLDNENQLESVAGKASLSYSKFLINTQTSVDVIIRLMDNATGGYNTVKAIKDVRFYKNKRTILTGNIYTSKSATTGFTVAVNDEFDPEPVRVNF